MCVCINFVCMYKCMFLCKYVCVHVCICVCVRACVCVCVCVCVCLCVCECMCVCFMCFHMSRTHAAISSRFDFDPHLPLRYGNSNALLPPSPPTPPPPPPPLFTPPTNNPHTDPVVTCHYLNAPSLCSLSCMNGNILSVVTASRLTRQRTTRRVWNEQAPRAAFVGSLPVDQGISCRAGKAPKTKKSCSPWLIDLFWAWPFD